MADLRITLDDYHRWLGELYAQVQQLNLALRQANASLVSNAAPADAADKKDTP